MESMNMATGMPSMDMSSTAAPMASTPTSSPSSGMGMSGMGMGSGCKISMLWNWYSVDACFISSTWRITSKGKFAGSCIGVICLVIALEFLRRLQREYDAYLVKQHRVRNAQTHSSVHEQGSEDGHGPDIEASGKGNYDSNRVHVTSASSPAPHPVANPKSQRLVPTVFQQAIRALLHMLQFAVAYFIMLLAMYYNGYIIICIIIGAYLGSFIFSWEGIQMTDA
ncbi:MAG: hypothetical protein LQ349_009711 [Xanthoria aureola]|nr:MAG: hypothetical protein LQ349_009711 [Xanthoria aureola]